MAMQVQNVTPDLTSKRGTVNLFDPTTGDNINANFPLNLTGNETLNQASDMAKARAKQILQAAVAVL